MIDLSVRVKNPNVWEVRAKELGLMDEVVTTPAVLDEDGAEVTPAETDWVWKKGVYVDPIETVYVEKPTYDSEGTQTSQGLRHPGNTSTSGSQTRNLRPTLRLSSSRLPTTSMATPVVVRYMKPQR